MDTKKRITEIDNLLKNIKDMKTGPEYKDNDPLINGYNIKDVINATIKQLENEKNELKNIKK